MATLFEAEFKPDVLGRGRPGTSRDKSLRLLGGVEKVRSALGEATKQDELLKKTLVKKSWKPKGGARRRGVLTIPLILNKRERKGQGVTTIGPF